MGVSTDAMLVYGIPLSEDHDGDDWPDALKDEFGDLDERYYGSRGEPSDVILVEHCSSDYPQFIAGIRGSYLVAYRGYPQRIAVEDIAMVPSKGWDSRLQAFLAKHKLETADGAELGWYLASHWGQ